MNTPSSKEHHRMRKARIAVVSLALAAGLALGGAALADPEEGGKNPSGICKGSTDAQPPTCPPRNN